MSVQRVKPIASQSRGEHHLFGCVILYLALIAIRGGHASDAMRRVR